MKMLLMLMFISAGFITKAQVIKNNELQLAHPITFVGESAIISPSGVAGLQEIKGYLEAKPYISLMRIEGHVAGLKNNQSLSEQRAVAVAKWLTANGVDCKRLIAVGFGDKKPSGTTVEMNSRIVVINAALRGHNIGGMPTDGGGNIAGDPCK